MSNNNAFLSPSEISRNVTKKVLSGYAPHTVSDAILKEIPHKLYNAIQDEIEMHNAARVKSRYMPQPKCITPAQVADIIKHLFPCCNILGAGSLSTDTSRDLLAIYQADGDNAGIYVTSETYFKKIICNFIMKLMISFAMKLSPD